MNTSLYGGIIEISPDGQPITPELILAYRGGTKHGVIHNVTSFEVGNHLMNANEISFDVHKTADGFDCELWDSIKDFKLVYIPHFENASYNPWYELTVTVDEDDETVKHCEGVHIQEAELSQLTLNDVQINTEDDIARDDYVPTIIYNPDNAEGSLLNRILKDKASHYQIFHVDSSLANLQRTFSWDGSTITDAFDDIATEIEGIFVYGEYSSADGKIHRTISLYDLNDVCMECGERGTFTNKVCPKCGTTNIKYGYGTDSGIFLSHENFASSITYSSNKDSVKNCFRLVAGDDLMTATIRNINPSGSQYIWYLSNDVRNEMSSALHTKLEEYDEEYNAYRDTKDIEIPSNVVNDYNILVEKYKAYDSSLEKISYPVVGYSALTEFYYQALNFYNLLKTTLAPASAKGTPTTAKEEAAKLTSTTLSPVGIQNAETASATTVNLAVANYAKVYVDTALYRVTATTNSYVSKVWKGTLTLSSYSDDEDSATTSELTIYITDDTEDYIKCQLEKAMKKNDSDATGTVALFKMDESHFKEQLSYYSIDNLNILAGIVRGCLDVMIQQGIADRTVSAYADLYNSLYIPYYNKSEWIQDELREREAEALRLRGSKSYPNGVLDYIEKQRQAIADKLDMHTYLGDSLWAEFCSFRRDDEYKNDNFISDGLTDRELIEQAKEFYKNAEREIVKAATLQHTISCNLNNFLLIKEQDVESSPVPIVTIDGINLVTNDTLYLVKGDAVFSPLLVNFDIGNWIHIEIDNKLYRLRMTDYQIRYDNLDSLDVEFSDVTYGLGYMSDTQDILAKASSMATSYSMTVRQANKGNKANQQIVDMVENGLSLTNKKIVNAADNQNMVVDESGMLMREKNEFGDDYSNEQVKIINHGFYYTNDNWKTVQTGLGKFIYYDPESGTYKEDYGLIAHKIVGNIILGNEVGIYNESGSVKIDKDGFTVTADANDTNPNLFTLQRKNEDGSYTKYIYVDDDGNIKINGKHIQMTTSEDLGSYIDSTIKQEAAALVIQLSNDYVGISTDADGNGGDFSNCYVDVKAFSGSTDITKSGDVEWTISPTSGVVGEWDAQNFRYTVTGLNTNIGEVVFDVEYNGLNVSKSFRISKIKDGRKGETGLDGKDGEDGTSNFIHIKYSPVANPTDDLMTETPSTYIGVCVDENLADPTTADSYTWSRFRGNDGQDGTPGTDGEDGVSTYVHFAYAQSSDGSLNFSITEYDGATYLGVYTDTFEADSTDYTKYAWSLIKGADGESISILSTEVAYIPSDDGVNPPNAYSLATNDGNIIVNEDGDEIATHKWLTEIPYVVAGSYLWTRTTVNYSDGTSTVTYSVSRQGIDGTDGTDGLDGKDGKDGSSNYIHIKYSAYPNPTDDQISEIPSDYIGVCVNESLQDPESASSYTWSKFKGSDGTDGIPGKDCYVHFAYATSADGSQGFSKTEFTGAIYIGVYSDNTEADSDDYHDYAWSKIKGDDGKDGLPGKDGEDGKSSYIHIKYSSVASPSDEQMTEIPSAYIGVYVDYTEEDSDTASDYTWSRWQGKDGADGIDAKDAYVHFAYSTSSDGSENFSVTEFEGATYLGVYSDREQADSTDHTKYAWSKIKGKDVTIVSTKIEYIATTEKSTTPPESIELVDGSGKSLIDNSGNVFVTNKWSNEIPDLTDGSYLWTRTTVNYSDGNSTVTYTNAKQGDTGDAGRNYFLEMDATAVKIDGNNIITPDKLIVKGYYRDGNGDREVYPCRFVITKTYKSKLTETVLTTSSNVAEQSFDIYGEAEMPEFYTVEMHKAGQQPTEDNLLDIQTIPILVDSANMMIGARNLLKLSDKLEGCHYYGNTGVYSITEDEIDSKQVVKVQAASGSNTAKAVYYEIYTDNLIASEAGTKLTASMNVFARQNGTLNVCLANPNGVMKTTDEQQITLMPGWNKVYTVLTIQDTEFELVTDIRDSFVTSNNFTITTGDVGILSNVLRITDNMNSGDYYAIDYIQLEKGNRPTDAYPAPEDLTNYTDEMLSGMSDELKGIISDVLNQVIANKEEFDELTSETGQIEEIRRSSVDTQQHVDRLETNVDTYILKVDTVEGKVVDIEKTTECFSMEDAGLRITRKISGQPSSQQLSMLLSEQKLSFYQGTDEVAYFSNNKLYVTDAEILDKLQLGKFAFIPRSNGNLSFRYLGT